MARLVPAAGQQRLTWRMERPVSSGSCGADKNIRAFPLLISSRWTGARYQKSVPSGTSCSSFGSQIRKFCEDNFEKRRTGSHSHHEGGRKEDTKTQTVEREGHVY